MEEFYRVRLRAPLVNPQWSWGAVREADQAVFLRVWEDETLKLNGRRYMRLTASAHYAEHSDNLGWRERLRHLELVQAGASSYMVMCVAEEPNAAQRRIKSFNRDEVFVGGELIEHDNDWWLELAGRERVVVRARE